jgi:sugar phosphate isomerase/epimerase
MNSFTSRRGLFKIAGFGAMAAITEKTFGQAKSAADLTCDPKPGYKLGMASYSTRKFDLDKTIQMTKRLALNSISIKPSFHLPMDKTCEEQRAIAKKIRDAGLDFYAAGVIDMNTPEAVQKAFEFAKNTGIRIIIGVPEHHLLDLTEQKCKEYDIAVGIHNHGPTDKLYPSPTSAYELIKNRDKRLGLCVDIGHTQRCGIDPADEIEKLADRVIDIHFKDVTMPKAEGTTIEIGHGVIDIPKVLRILNKIGYCHIASFEFEKDQEDPLPGLAESVGYVRGSVRTLEA